MYICKEVKALSAVGFYRTTSWMSILCWLQFLHVHCCRNVPCFTGGNCHGGDFTGCHQGHLALMYRLSQGLKNRQLSGYPTHPTSHQRLNVFY